MIIDAKNDSDLNEIAYFVNDEEDRRSVNTLIEELEEMQDTKYAFFNPVELGYFEPKNY